MQGVGQILLVLTLLATVATCLTAIYGAVQRQAVWMRAARYGLLAVSLLAVAMGIILTHSFVTHDFGNSYVAHYSDREMPTIYLLASFWGGERGALLFWVLSLSIFSNIAVRARQRDRSPEYLSWVVAILAAAILFFLILMVFQTSPFDTWMAEAKPENGEGLNALLQNPVMAFHPPSLLTGYILFTIPFAFGMAALITKRLDDQWIADTRRWTIVSWIFLSIGLLLGARWAYMEIGWGFWWMWDPVENAGFIPWFTATAFLHSVMIQERRGMLKRWNVVLLAATFLLTIFGTFLTRSQLIASIHAFADSEVKGYFLWYLVVIFVFASALIIARWKALRSEAHVESLLSRESMFILNNVVFVFAAFITLYGTLMGKITESPAVRNVLGLDQPIVWDESKFNEVFVPIGIAILLLLGIGPLISWRRATARNFRKNFVWPLAWGSLITAVCVTIGIYYAVDSLKRIYGLDFGDAYSLWTSQLTATDWITLLTYWFCGFVLLSIAREFHLASKARVAHGAGGYFGNLFVVLFKNPRRYGGYVVHIGIVCLFIAFTGKAFKTEEKGYPIAIGQTHVVSDQALTLVEKGRRYSEADGCVITDATFVLMPIHSTVAEDSIERLKTWLDERQAGIFHVRTAWDGPQMTVHFKDPAQRLRLLADAYLARTMPKEFVRVAEERDRFSEVWEVADLGLLQAMPMSAIEKLRGAKEALEASDLHVKVKLKAGSPRMRLVFDDAAAQTAFRQRMSGAKLPPWVLAVLDEPEEGAVTVVDRASGQVLVPESRFYPKKGEVTTEVAISQAVFFIDVYISMQPEMGMGASKPYVKTMVVIFPLVNFLWIGGLLLLVGGVICLTPRWLGKTLASFVSRGRTVAEDVGPLLAFLAAGGVALALLAGGEARAQSMPEPTGFRPPPGTSAEVRQADVLLQLDCACETAASEKGAQAMTVVPLGDAACKCPRAATDRAAVSDLFVRQPEAYQASGRAKYEVYKALVELNPEWESRIRFDHDAFITLVKTTRNTCEAEYPMTFDQTRATCHVKNFWLSEWRRQLAAGVSREQAFLYYVAGESALPQGGKHGGVAWQPYELQTSDEKAASYGLPVAIGVLVTGIIAFVVVRGVKRSRRRAELPAERELVGAKAGGLSAADRARLEDELEVFDA